MGAGVQFHCFINECAYACTPFIHHAFPFLFHNRWKQEFRDRIVETLYFNRKLHKCKQHNPFCLFFFFPQLILESITWRGNWHSIELCRFVNLLSSYRMKPKNVIKMNFKKFFKKCRCFFSKSLNEVVKLFFADLELSQFSEVF